MRKFLKIFIVSFSFFFIAMGIGAYSYLKDNDIKLENNLGIGFYENVEKEKVKKIKKPETKPRKPKVYKDLKQAIEGSERINFLILGLEDVRTDTIILASFCEDTKKINLIHIPRDTYVERKGYKRADQQKINSIYGTSGISALKDTVSGILNEIPIDHYLTIDYKAVENIVDEIGGVKVEVPFKMSYQDPTSNPPITIDIPKGEQLLDGEKALQFLRYRKGIGNKGYKDGDIGRIKAQQEFLGSFIDKAMDNRLKIVKEGFKHLKTDMGLLTAFAYARKASGMTGANIEIDILPGAPSYKSINRTKLSFYIIDEKGIDELLKRIYNVGDDQNK